MIARGICGEMKLILNDWKDIIIGQAKWGEQKTNIGRPCNREYGPEEFYLKLKEAL
jgi:hypothetical protein